MTELHIPLETFVLARQVRELRTALHAAKLEVDRLDDELQAVLEQYRPLQMAAMRAFTDALGEFETVKSPPRPAPIIRSVDPPKAA